MTPRSKRVRDLTRTETEYPRYRKEIEVRGWVPHVVCDAEGAYWDGQTACDRDGQFVSGLSDAGRKQMIKMILDGFFGNEVKNALIDENRYWRIRDHLITWPNQEAIERERLHVLDVRPRET